MKKKSFFIKQHLKNIKKMVKDTLVDIKAIDKRN